MGTYETRNPLSRQTIHCARADHSNWRHTVQLTTGLRTAALLTAGMMTSGCLTGFASVEGSGNIVTLQPDLTGFTEVSAGGGARARIVAGDDYSVVVRIDDNFQDDVRVEVEDGRLNIGMRSMFNYRNRHLEVDVTMPDLQAVSVSGGARAVLSGFDLDHAVDARVSGGARLEGELVAARLSTTASGGARAELAGSAESVSVRGSGGSRTDLSSLSAQSVDVSLSGGSRADVYATQELTGGVSGGARVTYDGGPATIDVGQSGGGRVSARK